MVRPSVTDTGTIVEHVQNHFSTVSNHFSTVATVPASTDFTRDQRLPNYDTSLITVDYSTRLVLERSNSACTCTLPLSSLVIISVTAPVDHIGVAISNT